MLAIIRRECIIPDGITLSERDGKENLESSKGWSRPRAKGRRATASILRPRPDRSRLGDCARARTVGLAGDHRQGEGHWAGWPSWPRQVASRNGFGRHGVDRPPLARRRRERLRRGGDRVVGGDDAADTGVPRLIAAGADRTRVNLVMAVEDRCGERRFNLAHDLDRLEKDLDLRGVNLLVIDPTSAYLNVKNGKAVDRNNAGGVRTVLDRLGTFAARHDLGVLAISHLNKSSGARAITRIMGSQEWAAAPRAVFLVTEEAGTERRLFLPLKNNLAPDRIGYAFEIENKLVGDGIRSSAVVWSNDPVTISADEALAATAKKKGSSGAVEFLEEVLAEGPMDQSEVVRLGKEAGFTEKNLRSARENLGVKPRKEGFGANGKWVWVPPGGATVLKLVVNNKAKAETDPGNKDDHEAGENVVTTAVEVIDQSADPESGSGGTNGDDVA